MQGEYPLEARYVCDECFGPLEVAYDFSGLEAEGTRRRIQAGPASIWRYADFLPFETPPKTALAAGITPLIRADRLAERLGLGEVWVKNDAANPTHSFKDRVVTVALAKARGARLRGGGVRVHRQPRQRGGRPRRRGRAGVVRLRAGRPRGAEDPRDRRLRHQPGGRARQLRRRQPALHRALGRARLGVRERERAALLRRGLEDAGLRDRRAARVRAARPRGGPDRVGVAVHQDRARLRGVARGRPGRGRAAGLQRRPGRGLLAGGAGLRRGPRRLPAGQAETRSPSRWPSATRPTVRTRWTWRGARAAASTRSPTTRSAPASACWPRPPASSPRPPAA